MANNGDLLFLNKGSTSPDKAFVDAIFALAAPGHTAVIKGSDGTFRIGRFTEMAPEQVDPNFPQRVTDAGISMDAYRRADSAIVLRDLVSAQVVAEVVDSASQQREVSVMVLENNGGQPVAAGAVLVKHILYSPNNNSSTASSLKPDDPAWAAAKQEAVDAVAKLKAGTATFAALAASSDDTGSAARNGFLPYYSLADAAHVARPGVRGRHLRPRAHARPAAGAGPVRLRMARDRVRLGRRSEDARRPARDRGGKARCRLREARRGELHRRVRHEERFAGLDREVPAGLRTGSGLQQPPGRRDQRPGRRERRDPPLQGHQRGGPQAGRGPGCDAEDRRLQPTGTRA